jgi:amino acid permease
MGTVYTKPVIHSVSLSIYIAPWLGMVCFAALFAAALMHWQRTRHCCLLVLATAALLATLNAVARHIVFVLPGLILDSGTGKFDQRVLTALNWLPLVPIAVAAFGGIGAIHWAIQLKRRT